MIKSEVFCPMSEVNYRTGELIVLSFCQFIFFASLVSQRLDRIRQRGMIIISFRATTLRYYCLYWP